MDRLSKRYNKTNRSSVSVVRNKNDKDIELLMRCDQNRHSAKKINNRVQIF